MMRSGLFLLGLAAFTLGCHGDDSEPPPASRTVGPDDRAEPTDSDTGLDTELARESETDSAIDGSADSSKPAVLASYTPASSLASPIETRVGQRTRAVYADPDRSARLRGKIQKGDPFYIYATRDGPGCAEPWAQVADAGWVCLQHSRIDDSEPAVLPHLPRNQLLPYIYARHTKHEAAGTPAIPVYAGIAAFNRGDAPVSTIPAYGSYAFVKSIANDGKRLLMTMSRQVIAAEGLRIFKPSEFAGFVLEQGTIPSGTTLAWSVRTETLIYADASSKAEVVGTLPYHDPVFVIGEGKTGTDGKLWFEVAEQPAPGREQPAPHGWINEFELRRFIPVAPPEPILGGQITVDIDVPEQVLSVWREGVPVFVTLVSSGKPGDSTPLGLFRIETKYAFGKMASLESSDDPYWVDAVPWAMYFDGRYALHAAYWHNRFGHRLSHGCVNLSPKDAKYVFDLITPTMPPGWLIVHEHEVDPGTLVRVRNGARPIIDKRVPIGSTLVASAEPTPDDDPA